MPRSRRRATSGAKPAQKRRMGFGRASLWTVLGTYVPGLGLLRAGRREGGILAFAAFVAFVAVFLTWFFFDLSALLQLVVNSSFLRVLVFLLPLAVLGWAALIVITHLMLRPRPLSRGQRLAGAVLVGFLTLTVAAPFAVAARYSFDQARLLDTIFKDSSDLQSGTAPTLQARDTWKNKPRVNILLLGGDAGRDRTGTRTDTVMLASIDTRTGNTVLISLPRNTARMPFPADSPLHKYYPDGFTDGNGESLDFMLTELYDQVPQNVPPDVLGPTDNLGADALKLAVGEATGLKVDYYALVELEGFHKLIDALGGITVNINTWVAIGGNTSAGIRPKGALAPGPNQHLNGDKALWYARGRYGAGDFERMDRQRCVIDAVIKQANPTNILTRYEAVARQGKDIVLTDVPQDLLPAMVDLSLRVKRGRTTSIVFRNAEDGFISANPDFAMMRARIDRAINPPAPAGPPAPSAAPSRTATPTRGPTTTSAPSPAAPAPAPAEDLSDSCAFKPELASKQPPRPPWEM